ncbi:MAG: murein biosynthesis integral membrane protein MurJ [Anaerolineales bacterium]|nr:murein biosynthesis integral membrane protein MurJ [Anaerolineales bacterium]
MARLTESNVPANPGMEPIGGLAKAAGIISLGNMVSRVFGMMREFVKADLFGATGLVSAFEVANIVPTMIYDLLIGGMISSAIVPVLSDFASLNERRDSEFWRLANTLFSLALVSLSIFVVILEFFAPQIAWLFGARNFTDPELYPIATHLLRIMLPAILFLNLSGLMTGVLFSLKKFTLPAFTAAVFNAFVVAAALLFPNHIDSLAWGILAGSIAQVFIQIPSLKLEYIRWLWDTQHAALRRMVKLYLPIVLGVIVSQIAIGVSYNLATKTGDESVATMRYATTLIQFPLGLVATAISVAILPTLSRQAIASDGDQAFKSTLAQGLNLVLILIIPATVGLFVLAFPIVGLAFEHGGFSAESTIITANVLKFYLIGLPFAAVDQLLIFAFYARKNTLTPALVGVLSVVVYLLVAQVLIKPMGLFSLMVADSVKHMVHAGVMAILMNKKLGGIRDSIGSTTLKAILASAIMGMVLWGIGEIVTFSNSLVDRLIVVFGGGLIGLAVFSLIISRLNIPEARMLWQLVSTKLLRKDHARKVGN